MVLPIHNATCNHQEEFSSPHHANGFTTQTATYLADSNGLEMHHVKDIIKNESVSIQVSAPGWIIFSGVSLMRFMAKSTGSKVNMTLSYGKNESVSIQASAPGWIIFSAVSLMRLMAKSTGSTVNIRFLE